MNTSFYSSIANQLMTKDMVELVGELPIRRIGHQRRRPVSFIIEGREYMAIEQNAEKASRRNQLAWEGDQVVEFKEARSSKFVAVAVDGMVIEYDSLAKRNRRRDRG